MHTLNICAILVVLSCVYRRATTRRGAVKESRLQISPRKAASSAARCCEETGAWAPTIALTVSPTGQNWTEHKDRAFLFHFTFVFFLSLDVLCLPRRRNKNKLVPLSNPGLPVFPRHLWIELPWPPLRPESDFLHHSCSLDRGSKLDFWGFVYSQQYLKLCCGLSIYVSFTFKFYLTTITKSSSD